MNQTVYFKYIQIILIAFMVMPIEAKLIKPSKNGEEKEILIIGGKRRLYYPLKKEGLFYTVEGPARLEFISRYPSIKKSKKSLPFNYNIVLDAVDTIQVKHRYKIQKSIKSIQHPKHKYTHSGNYFINLEKGSHSIQILENEDLKYPVLLRVITKDFEKLGKQKQVISPTVHQKAVSVVSDGKSVNYFECSSKVPLQIEAKGEKVLKILSRLEFTDTMGQEESYRIRISEGKKIVGTYYFNSERSSASHVDGKPAVVPGKWRTCEINIPKGKHRYTVEAADKDKTVLTRFILY